MGLQFKSMSNENIHGKNGKFVEILQAMNAPKRFALISKNMSQGAVFEQKSEQELVKIITADRDVFEHMKGKLWILKENIGDFERFEMGEKGRAIISKVQRPDDLPRPKKSFSKPKNNGALRSETPIELLARKKDTLGEPYLDARMVAAAARIREDFEVSEVENIESLKRMAQNKWDIKFLDVYTKQGAQTRISKAMFELGDGLSDIVWQVCCHLKGVESAEQELGWSARSGKVVLRIALMRLAEFYAIPNVK